MRAAVARFSETAGLSVVAASSVYETAPVGDEDQPAFLNAVVEVCCGLEPATLMQRLLEIERDGGRVRDEGRRWGPRSIDIDVLVWGARRVDDTGIRVPHPRLHERWFVLAPLAEIAPDLEVPGTGGTASALLASLRLAGDEGRLVQPASALGWASL